MARGGFRGGYGGMNQANMMKQAQKMQQDFLRMQKELEEKEFTAKAGGGMVTAVVNGNREVTKIEIKPEAVDPDDVEMLEDLVLAAVNEALPVRGGLRCHGQQDRRRHEARLLMKQRHAPFCKKRCVPFYLRKKACSSRWTRPSAGSKQARPRRTQVLP